jgi:hypothetical protein
MLYVTYIWVHLLNNIIIKYCAGMYSKMCLSSFCNGLMRAPKCAETFNWLHEIREVVSGNNEWTATLTKNTEVYYDGSCIRYVL